MNTFVSQRLQRGATLVVGLIMLALITLTVITAFTLSSTNLKSVGNMQFRNEAIAAANDVIEQVISGPFALNPAGSQFNIDVNNDDKFDYEVNVAAPVCMSASVIPLNDQTGRGTSTEVVGFEVPDPVYDTLWDIQATVTDTKSGTSITVHQGMLHQPLDQTKRTAFCP
jgi:hypothetical protein